MAVDACSITYEVAFDTADQVRSTTSLADDAHMKAPEAPPCSEPGAPGAPAALASPGAAGEATVHFVPDPGGPAATIVSLPDVGETAVPSLDVSNEYVAAPSVPAGPLTTAIVNDAAVDRASAHVLPPLLPNLMTTTLEFVGSDPVGVQLVGKLAGDLSTIGGVVELVVKPVGNVATM